MFIKEVRMATSDELEEQQKKHEDAAGEAAEKAKEAEDDSFL
jgi:hypothetical protein